MGQAFDAAKNDDSFYLPPGSLRQPRLQARSEAVPLTRRQRCPHDHHPRGQSCYARRDLAHRRAEELRVRRDQGDAVVGRQDLRRRHRGDYKDIQDGAKYDLLIAALAAIALILLIMVFITRSLVAALIIVGTVVLSLGASSGCRCWCGSTSSASSCTGSCSRWPVILLLAVGADYNLLLISRFKEEIEAGLKTGTIRAMAGTGGVVTAAGLVFAATMSSFIFSDLEVLGQIGTTIGLGLLFDTLIVRTFMTPSIATLLGRWFWWPQHVRPRPASQMLRPYGPRRTVRDLLETEPKQREPRSRLTH